MTDLREVFEDEVTRVGKTEDDEEKDDTSSDEGEGPDVLKPRKRRNFDKAERDLEGRPQKKGKNQIDADPSFFSGL
jgi:hypothetical protein